MMFKKGDIVRVASGHYYSGYIGVVTYVNQFGDHIEVGSSDNCNTTLCFRGKDLKLARKGTEILSCSCEGCQTLNSKEKQMEVMITAVQAKEQAEARREEIKKEEKRAVLGEIFDGILSEAKDSGRFKFTTTSGIFPNEEVKEFCVNKLKELGYRTEESKGYFWIYWD